MRIERVVSGGQTGVDRAALDAARACGFETGGWCPRGRRAEDGPISAGYPLQETPLEAYEQRTAWNVRDSDATLVLLFDDPAGGTALTVEEARRQGRPVRVQLLAEAAGIEDARRWMARHGVRVLNVAGPRESEAPGIYAAARRFLEELLQKP